MRIIRTRTGPIAPDARDRGAVRQTGTATIRTQQEDLLPATAQDTVLETTAHRAAGVDTLTPLEAVRTRHPPVMVRAGCPARSLVPCRARPQAPYQFVFHQATLQVA